MITASKLNSVINSVWGGGYTLSSTGSDVEYYWYGRLPSAGSDVCTFRCKSSRGAPEWPEVTCELRIWVGSGFNDGWNWHSIAGWAERSVTANMDDIPSYAGFEGWLKAAISWSGNMDVDWVEAHIEIPNLFVPANCVRGEKLIYLDNPENSGNIRDIGALLTVSRLNSGLVRTNNIPYL